MAERYERSLFGRVLLLTLTLCQVICLCRGQDFGKLAKLRQDLENYKLVPKTVGGGYRMDLHDAPPPLHFGQSLSQACADGVKYVLTHNYTNGIGVTVPIFIFAADATGKPGAGILEGNSYAYGSYDECLELDHTQYCLVPVNATYVKLSFGVCAPVECNTTDIIQYVYTYTTIISELKAVGMAGFVQGEIICEHGSPAYSGGAIAMIVVCAVFAAAVLLSSAIDCILNVIDSTSIDSLKMKAETVTDFDVTEKAPLLNETSARPERHPKGKDSTYMDFVTAFSLFKVVPTILSTKQPPSAITSINGIRVISMFWVILGHTHLFAVYISGADNTAFIFGKVVPRFTFQAIINATFSVDSFFFLSGLLVAYLTLRQMSRNNGRFPVLAFYLHRFLRLTPTYAFVLFFYWFMSVHLADGPKYAAITGEDGDLYKYCDKYWWTNLLYINNLRPWKMNEECMGWTWYLANDMQFFVVSPLMVVLLYYWWPLGLVSVCFFLFGSFASTAAIVDYYDFNATFTLVQTPISQSDEIYIKPYARISPYLVGIVLGYLLYRKVRIPFNRIVNWAFYLTALVLAAGFLVAPLYGLYDTWHGHVLDHVDNVFYFTFSRFSWGLGLALLVFVCQNGYGWILNSFLSMPLWIPLGRLTFTAYLIHPVVLFAVFGSLRYPVHYNDTIMAVYAVGCVVLSYGAAAAIAVFVEFPLSNLEAAIFKAVGLGVRESTRQVTNPTQNTKLETK